MTTNAACDLVAFCLARSCFLARCVQVPSALRMRLEQPLYLVVGPIHIVVLVGSLMVGPAHMILVGSLVVLVMGLGAGLGLLTLRESVPTGVMIGRLLSLPGLLGGRQVRLPCPLVGMMHGQHKPNTHQTLSRPARSSPIPSVLNHVV